MSKRRFRPSWRGTLLTLIGLALFISLGNWQLRRLAWKEGLIAGRAAALAAPAIPLPDSGLSRELDFRHVTFVGRLLNDRELFLAAADSRGNDGFHVITPVALADGRYLLLDRGFVPATRRDARTRASGEIAGAVHITGVYRIPVHPRRDGIWAWLIPSAGKTDNFWFQIDVPVMAEADRLPVDRTLPYYVEADATPNPGGLPIGGQTDPTLTNNHLQYAITWYAFAFILAVSSILYVWREPPSDRQGKSDDRIPLSRA